MLCDSNRKARVNNESSKCVIYSNSMYFASILKFFTKIEVTKTSIPKGNKTKVLK